MSLSKEDLDEIIFKIKDIFLSKSLDQVYNKINSKSKKTENNLKSIIEEDIVLYLLEIFPDCQIISENLGIINQSLKNKIYTIIIKGLSGTENLNSKISLYGFSIAILKGKSIKLSKIEYSLICNVNSNIHITAIKGKGILINNEKYKKDCQKSKIIICNLKSYNKNYISCLTNLIKKSNNILSLGSSVVSFIYLILGSSIAYYNFSKSSKANNFIAASLILNEIGGLITDIEGNYINDEIDLKKNYNFIASRNKKIHSEFIKLIK